MVLARLQPKKSIDLVCDGMSRDGYELRSDVETTDFAASDVSEAQAANANLELQKAMETLGDVSRYRNTRATKGSLIILSDSFGRYSASWYSRFYRDVMHISTNAAARVGMDLKKIFPDALVEHQVKN